MAHGGFMEALGLGKAAWIMFVCVCVLACLDYVAGWTHMPQEIEPRDQGSPLVKAAGVISFHFTKERTFYFFILPVESI